MPLPFSSRPLAPGQSTGSASLPSLPTPEASVPASTVGFSELVAEMPDDAFVPIRWVRQRLAAEAALRDSRARPSEATRETAGPAERAVTSEQGTHEISAEEYGQRRSPRRSAEWVRDACRAGRIPSARKDGREWMIPEGAVEIERRRMPTGGVTPAVRHLRHAGPDGSTSTRRTRHATAAREPSAYPRWGDADAESATVPQPRPSRAGSGR